MQLVGHPAAGLHGAAARDAQGADGLHHAAAGLGQPAGASGLHRPRGSLGVERIRLAALTALAPVGAVHLEHDDAPRRQAARQAGAIAAGALDPDPIDGAELGGPREQGLIAARGAGQADAVEQNTAFVERGGHVAVEMGVDAEGDEPVGVWHAEIGHRSSPCTV